MKVLLIGSGGREHALAWALAASPHLTRLYAAPGNGGIANEAEIADIDTEDNAAVAGFCKAHAIDLVVVGPEAPLAAGLADRLIAEGLRVFGPSQAAAQLESSKVFTKEICREAKIPTADWAVFEDANAAKSYVSERGAPIVVKADGLAAGKGVIVAATIDEAYAAIDTILDGSLDGEGGRVLIEDALEGEEVSVFALCDGETALYFGSAQDHKRVFDGDTGPNTGGMGAYSPAPILTDALRDQTMETIIAPTLKAMADRDTPFRGVIFAGLMLTESGPQLIEFNVRFGDPECQVLMMRLKDDLLSLLNAAVDGVLSTMSVRWRDETALTVVVASKGYPGSYEKGVAIDGLGALSGIEDTEIFHSGTKKQGETYVSSGGRVLAVTVLGNSVREAQARAYEVTNRLNWPGGFFRRDIGWRAIAREAGPTS